MKRQYKRKTTRRLALLLGAVSAMALSGCAAVEPEILRRAPEVGAVTQANHSLRTLPLPAEKTVVAVYQYDDLTGQYKERENVQTLSRAVTQGGAAMLIKALQDAGEGRWFTVLERTQLDNLLRERQILSEMRRLYRSEERPSPVVLPPLMHASIIIEGGIIGYDTNTITGGAGARFLGIGGDTKYKQDTVTVTLRAVSAKSGEVLTTVTARKAVASYALQGGAFRYLKLDELLEAEAGVTYNEPKQIAVESAIEAAVKALIIEGAENGIWSFANEDLGAEYIADYREEKYDDRLTVLAQIPAPPATADAAKTTQTVALWPRFTSSTSRRAYVTSPRAAPTSAAPHRQADTTAPTNPVTNDGAKAEPRDDLPPAPPEGEGEVLGASPSADTPREIAGNGWNGLREPTAALADEPAGEATAAAPRSGTDPAASADAAAPKEIASAGRSAEPRSPRSSATRPAGAEPVKAENGRTSEAETADAEAPPVRSFRSSGAREVASK